jgi:hypothetical protein
VRGWRVDAPFTYPVSRVECAYEHCGHAWRWGAPFSPHPLPLSHARVRPPVDVLRFAWSGAPHAARARGNIRRGWCNLPVHPSLPTGAQEAGRAQAQIMTRPLDNGERQPVCEGASASGARWASCPVNARVHHKSDGSLSREGVRGRMFPECSHQASLQRDMRAFIGAASAQYAVDVRARTVIINGVSCRLLSADITYPR